jgi:hypothetical protein
MTLLTLENLVLQKFFWSSFNDHTAMKPNKKVPDWSKFLAVASL